MMRRRAGYGAGALGVIIVGLLVHFAGAALPGTLRDIAGDALWAAMMVCWVSMIVPTMSLFRRGLMAYAICIVVEVSQLCHAPALDAVRHTTLGHLVLGSDFDAHDFASYAVGVLLAVATIHLLRRRGRAGGA